MKKRYILLIISLMSCDMHCSNKQRTGSSSVSSPLIAQNGKGGRGPVVMLGSSAAMVEFGHEVALDEALAEFGSEEEENFQANLDPLKVRARAFCQRHGKPLDGRFFKGALEFCRNNQQIPPQPNRARAMEEFAPLPPQLMRSLSEANKNNRTSLFLTQILPGLQEEGKQEEEGDDRAFSNFMFTHLEREQKLDEQRFELAKQRFELEKVHQTAELTRLEMDIVRFDDARDQDRRTTRMAIGGWLLSLDALIVEVFVTSSTCD